MKLINIGFGNMVSANMDSDHVILSAVQPETVANRVDNEEEEQEEMEDDE